MDKKFIIVMLLVAGVFILSTIIPALLDASSNAAVLLGVLLVVGFGYLGIKYFSAIVDLLGLTIKEEGEKENEEN